MKRPRRSETGQALRQAAKGGHSGQAMAEYAVALPVLILLLFGMTFAAFYAFRAAAADWGVFITGVAEGAYDTPATNQARQSVVWMDIRSGLTTGAQLDDRQVQSQIGIVTSHPWLFGLNLAEAHQGGATFRLWRFYAGPPEGEIE